MHGVFSGVLNPLFNKVIAGDAGGVGAGSSDHSSFSCSNVKDPTWVLSTISDPVASGFAMV